jgi:hypothetical protein
LARLIRGADGPPGTAPSPTTERNATGMIRNQFGPGNLRTVPAPGTGLAPATRVVAPRPTGDGPNGIPASPQARASYLSTRGA